MMRLIGLATVTLMIIAGCATMSQTGGQAGGQSGPGDGPSLVGGWIGQTIRGGVLTLTFNEDGTVKGSMMAGFPTTFNGRYTLDYSKNPKTVDIFDIDNTSESMSLLPVADRERRNTGGEARYYGIFTFLDSGNLQIIGNFGSADNRPEEFTEMAIELERK